MQWKFNEETKTLEMDFDTFKQLMIDSQEVPLDEALSMLAFQLGEVNLSEVKVILIKDVQLY